ncbi:hypothetical protein D187_007361 [Cystobacter fuscus DSM 2262]|uniref:Uncharacterized protein n=1 Tax=Cystobacter fuscus (strain ATCC 25194 / DSM 2262 / NBRC 100088 / M29) TaxID=1242864 RepID=S9Q3Y5_CYSF2|nr:hypothetical protein D187_007361 [Cystobacter fuscus DSM 2262]
MHCVIPRADAAREWAAHVVRAPTRPASPYSGHSPALRPVSPPSYPARDLPTPGGFIDHGGLSVHDPGLPTRYLRAVRDDGERNRGPEHGRRHLDAHRHQGPALPHQQRRAAARHGRGARVLSGLRAAL